MTKDVLVSVKGRQTTDEGIQEPLELITTGTYFEKDGAVYVFYEEIMEGVDKPLKNRLVINGRSVQLNKTGPVSVKMNFDEKIAYETVYQTPYANFNMMIRTDRITTIIEESSILVDIEYSLDLDMEKMADCQITISVKGKVSE